jgi:O-methyltransferase
MAEQLSDIAGISEYVRAVSSREDDVLADLRTETAALPGGRSLQVLAEEGQLLGLLVRLTGASTVVEVGTFTGYSTVCLARALPPGGRVITCDISDRWPAIGRPFWARAGVADRIDTRIGPAADTLAALVGELGSGAVDLVFIDADKTGYAAYYEQALTLLRPGGLVVVDNTLLFGRVVDPGADDEDTGAIRAFNTALHTDGRIELSLLPMADGITLACKRP